MHQPPRTYLSLQWKRRVVCSRAFQPARNHINAMPNHARIVQPYYPRHLEETNIPSTDVSSSRSFNADYHSDSIGTYFPPPSSRPCSPSPRSSASRLLATLTVTSVTLITTNSQSGGISTPYGPVCASWCSGTGSNVVAINFSSARTLSNRSDMLTYGSRLSPYNVHLRAPRGLRHRSRGLGA